MQISIASIERKTTSTGKAMLTVKDSTGQFYSAWPDLMGDIFPTLPSGTVIDAEIKVNGKYKNIAGWKKVGAEPAPLPTVPGNAPTSPVGQPKPVPATNQSDQRQDSIERQASMKKAVDFVVGTKGGEGKLEDVAEAFNFLNKLVKGS